jgi:hypothetical protein
MSGISVGNGLSKGVGLSVGSGFSRGGGLYFSGFSVAPTLNLDFTTMTALPSTITFSRPSNATYYDSTGKLTYAPNNLFTYSDTFSNAAWLTQAVSKSGSAGAWVITGNGASTQHVVYQTLSLASGTRYTVSLYITAGTSNYVYLNAAPAASATTWATAVFDLSTGVSGTASQTGVGATSGTIHSTSSTYLGAGLYRISMTYSLAGTSVDIALGLTTAATGNTFGSYGLITVATSGTVTVYNAQFEAVTYQTTPSTYNATTSAAYYGPRLDYNPATLAARGLLIEEARTNVVLQSQFSSGWTIENSTNTAGATVSPSGATDGVKFAATSATTNFTQFQVMSLTTGSRYTQSIFVKPAEYNFLQFAVSNTLRAGFVFNLTTGAITETFNAGNLSAIGGSIYVGNGWYRLWISFTPAMSSFDMNISLLNTATAASRNIYGMPIFAGTAGSGVYIWGAQVEEGAFPTSYIPTAANPGSRSADTANMTGTNFSSWYNQSEGSFVVNAALEGNSGRTFIVFDSGVTNYSLVDFATSASSASVVSGGSTVASFTLGSVSQGVLSKASLAYKLNDFACVLNGGAVQVDTSGAVPVSPNQLGIGNFSGTAQLNGWVSSFVFYPQRLPNATLQSLTS